MADRVRVRGISIHRPIIYGNTAVVLTQQEREALRREGKESHTHRWTVAVRSAASKPDSGIVGGADDISTYIKRVNFKLHETYPTPNRVVDAPGPFEITETGWGEFDVFIRITFIPESGEKPHSFYHHLKLHPWNETNEPEIPPLEEAIRAGPVHAWQYDEVVFNEPYNNFLQTLTAHPPTPLPLIKRRPAPYHSAHTASLPDTKMPGTPEYNQLMIEDEAERLRNATAAINADSERTKALTAAKEKELLFLKRKFGEV
ncbi:yeats-domain-containing protein [Cylindrobasidium torrendii FP15055 ss-10]|uniref:Protein AF-9 homolog n=1 Tax=Cylindrobasidium torrendii FP15055 ss-10 TaxID=1314674 RepID=A0A0D7BIV3_9AGAR|nr:yeats-domain-containing protein [Cylindrobasidium torrendii FP15055 ss-10]